MGRSFQRGHSGAVVLCKHSCNIYQFDINNEVSKLFNKFEINAFKNTFK